MKSLRLQLQEDVVTSYDQTKTTYVGRIAQKTVAGKSVVCPPLNRYVPTLDDTGRAPNAFFVTPNNRLFVIESFSSGTAEIGLYDFNLTTGAILYRGMITLTVINSPATTHTIRGLRVVDTGTTGWKIFVLTTGSVTANGGLYMANNIDQVDFVAVGFPVIPTASAPGQKAVYKLENSPFTITQGLGLLLDTTNSRIYVHNGVAATHQYYKFNYGGTITTVGASGITTDLFELATGNLPAVSGTIFNNNSERYVADPLHTANAGSPCAFFSSGTNAYLGKLSELTSGATTWPSLISTDFVSPLTYLNPTPTAATWQSEIDRAVFNIGNSMFITKPMVNATIDYFFGNSTDRYYELGVHASQEIIVFGGLTVTQLYAAGGWLFGMLTTTSQRGIVAVPIATGARYMIDHIITRVFDIGPTTFKTLGFPRTNAELTRPPTKVDFRTSGFGSATGGWTELPTDIDLAAVGVTGQVQFRVRFPTLNELGTTAPQIIDGYLAHEPISDISQNWTGSNDNTTSSSPARSAFRLVKAYATSVPKLYFRAYDDAGSLVASANTVDNPASFQYSTNNGGSWAALGTIPNVAGTTELRYNWSSPPGVRVTVSLRE